jgi:hypothetical protein
MIGAHVLAAAAIAGLAALSGSPASGAGISAAPVCGAGLQAGHAAPLSSVTVTNPGSTAEKITLAVAPVPPGSRLAGRGYPVPPSWVHVGYPRLLWVIGQHSVRLGPGASVSLPVTADVPAGARRGAYVAELAAVAGTSQAPGVALGAAASTYLIFTVGERVPHWPTSLLGLGCWTAPGQPVSWQEWSGTTMAAPPPGWHWTAADGWAYTPPPGWSWSWSDPLHPREVYQGGPARPCADAAAYGTGAPGGGPWIGGQYPDTSTAAGCAAWLRASADGTLGGEPAATVAEAHGAPLAARDSSSMVSVALAVAVLLAAGLLAAWLARRRVR